MLKNLNPPDIKEETFLRHNIDSLSSQLKGYKEEVLYYVSECKIICPNSLKYNVDFQMDLNLEISEVRIKCEDCLSWKQLK
jgi:hypothetical protein